MVNKKSNFFYFLFNKNTIAIFKKLIIIFTQTSILIYFDFKNYIYVKTNISEFAIVVIFLQLTYLIDKVN